LENEYTVGQAAQILNCNKSLLRFYEDEFDLNIPRTASNRRMYSDKEIEAFRYIARLKKEGRSNAQIKAVLKSERIEKFTVENTYAHADEQISVSGGNMNMELIFQAIAQLRDEINSLKDLSGTKEKDELLNENTRLREKLKEKTYELVETREKLNNAIKSNKKSFFK